MDYLCVFLQPSIQLRLSTLPERAEPLQWNGQAFQTVASNFFFDWICNSQGTVLGVEPHLFLPELEGWREAGVFRLPYVEWHTSFPRLWFSPERNGVAMGAEDWESYWYVGPERLHLLFFGLGFLSTEQVAQLRKTIGA